MQETCYGRTILRGFSLRLIYLSCLFCALNGFVWSDSSDETADESMEWMPNVSTRLDPASTKVNISADLLVWMAQEAGADCWAEVITSIGSASTNALESTNFGWDPGFRVGIGYEMLHDQWDTQAFYTWFYTQGTASVTSTPGSVHSTFLGNFYVNNTTGTGISGPAYQSGNIRWNIHFNIFDAELGRQFEVGHFLSMRPYTGLKGGWINQSLYSNWINPNLSGSQFYAKATENITNNFSGVGPLLGVNTRWSLYTNCGNSFSLFSNLCGAILWGHWSLSDVFQNTIGQQITVTPENFNGGASMFRTFMGLEWDARFRDNRSLFTMKLGYEMQFWLDQLQFYSFIGGRLVDLLTLQGGTLAFSFDF